MRISYRNAVGQRASMSVSCIIDFNLFSMDGNRLEFKQYLDTQSIHVQCIRIQIGIYHAYHMDRRSCVITTEFRPVSYCKT